MQESIFRATNVPSMISFMFLDQNAPFAKEHAISPGGIAWRAREADGPVDRVLLDFCPELRS